MQEYEYLGQLQQLDSRIDTFSGKLINLPEQEEYEELQSQLKETKQAQEEKEAKLAAEKHVQKKMEDELELLDLKIKHEEGKLYGGEIGNLKELKGIQEEVKLLKDKKDQMETTLLELLDKADNMNSEFNGIESKVKELTVEVQRSEEDYKKAIEEIEKQIEELKAKREKLSSGISPSLVSLYEEIRKSKRLAAVVIADGICQGCFVELPAEEVDKMFRDDKLWRCSQCRRILLK